MALSNISFKKAFFGRFTVFFNENIYEPREDSFLLAKALDKKWIRNQKCLDLGCGSGIQTMQLLENGADFVTAADIDASALYFTQFNLEENFSREKINRVTILESDLFENLDEKKFDVIAFNPPYVISDSLEEKALDGGKSGREVLDRFLLQAENLLNENGMVFFLQNDLNGFKETEDLLKRLHFQFEILARQKLFFEELVVFRAWKR